MLSPLTAGVELVGSLLRLRGGIVAISVNEKSSILNFKRL